MKKGMVLNLAGCIVLGLAPTAAGSVLAIWDFGPDKDNYTQTPAYYNTLTAPVLTLAGSDIDDNGKDGIAYTDAAGVFHGDGQAAAWDDINKSGSDNDAALFITLATTGFTDLAIRWDYKSEEAVSYDFACRTAPDGDWLFLADNTPITPGWDEDQWYTVTLDLSAVTGLNNQPYLQLRLDDLVEGPGNNKFAIDNIEITGVPEPAALTLLALGALLAANRRRP